MDCDHFPVFPSKLNSKFLYNLAILFLFLLQLNVILFYAYNLIYKFLICLSFVV
jgi:hypothetical protein